MELLGFAIIVLYLLIALRFWQGFHRTYYTQSRFVLSVLWLPLLLNKSYRQNFRRALLG
ncbi:hypothetical protein NK55_01875 [Thermosynechococcus sp. NK55a]|jgi:hypothetical protein|uniref:hypothetical protein n=1 Tax=unclassified Thermosynechococcus TaxID=2622553 RepID=UPI0003D8E1F3|nr:MULTISPECIES: hypothetical protein [unclassified Thermosynechococcus]AHB87738.1 hypothetical protein NK55_01875 [Thermosynechococcus sp. NK55a]HIK23586.1 hypothetical protein [Thermosynechococcus sp. M3746_W2019_013]